ncbi:MAG TPA: hypothetical protein VFI13_08780, partial [Gemmatimonadales bacterium]|nr:hypothetical protein [Gemmatimonadales bacterium]
LPDSFIVNDNCAPNAVIGTSYGDSILVPWTKSLPLIAALTGTNHTNLDCTVDANVVTPTEFAVMRNAVAAYNTHIQAVVAANPNFAYWDPNPTLLAKRAAGQIPAFPDLSTVGTGGSVGFGPYITLDGVHPSATAHKLIADSIASHLNAAFGTTIPIPVAP